MSQFVRNPVRTATPTSPLDAVTAVLRRSGRCSPARSTRPVCPETLVDP